MTRPAARTARARDEAGAVLVIVTFVLPILLFLVMFVIDIGDWYEHRHHLQTQADAAAFAGAYDFQSCFGIGAGDAAIFGAATDYAGATGDYWGATFNPGAYSGVDHNAQVGGTPSANVMALYQSPTYWQQSSPTDADLTTQTSPCNSPYIFDVKATEVDLPLFLPYLAQILPPVNAHARVQLHTITAANPGLPLAVPDVNPQQVAVTFVDERTQTELSGCTSTDPTAQPLPGTGCTFLLTKGSVVDGLREWAGPAAVDVPAGTSTIGVRVGVGNGVGSCSGVGGGDGFVCYAYPDDWQGLTVVRGYDPSVTASPTAPQLRAAWPTTTCAISPYFTDAALGDAGSCAAGFSADVDFGAGADLTHASVTATASSSGAGGPQTATLTRGADGIWRTAGDAFAIPVGAGSYDVAVAWKYGAAKGTFDGGKPVQRIFAGNDDASGPIKALSLSAYALASGNHDVTVSLGLRSNLEIAQPCDNGTSGGSYDCPTDRPIRLRFASDSGSQNYAVDCGLVPGHTGGDFYQELLYGCANSFSVNDAGVCPDPADPSPPSCVPIANFVGDKVGQLKAAMNDRFAPGGSCLADNYPSIDPADPRVVTLMVTSFDAFSGEGGSGDGVPVVTYATFYVTGWYGAVTGCSGINEPAPAGASKGDVWGHFIKYVVLDADHSDELCQPDINPCTAVLTK